MCISPCRQLDAHIHKIEGVLAIGNDVDHGLTCAVHTTSAPDAEILLAVLGLVHVVLVRHLNQVAQSDASVLMRIAIDIEGVLFAVITYETTVSGVIQCVGNWGVLALLRSGIGTGIVGSAFSYHHVGETVQHAIATSGIVDHLVMIDLDEVTAVHTDLVVGSATCGAKTIISHRTVRSIGSIHVLTSGTPEIFDLRCDGIHKERASVDNAHGLVERNESVFLGGIQGVDLGLTDEVDV